jgi:hypothetical protein
MPRSLTVREANFAAAFVRKRRARAAAISVGAKPKSASRIGSRLLKRQRVQDEIARVQSVDERYDKTAAKRAIARALKAGAISHPALGEFEWQRILDKAIADPAVVRNAAVTVGMVLKQVQLVVVGEDGKARIQQTFVYEPIPAKLVKAACILDKKFANILEDRVLADASRGGSRSTMANTGSGNS